ncbi:MAG: hypothetical protein IKT05_08465 [Fibrobacter sp.]|nr:hypothetical protein [Fibrobacter sp.]
MKFDNAFLLLCPIILMASACSESDKAAGGSIEDQNAISEDQIKEWYNFGVDENEVARTLLTGGELAVMNNGSGMRAECTADSSALAMTIQISEDVVISTLNASKLGESCDSMFVEFKASCNDKENSKFFSISNGCKDGSFDAACRISEIESDSANMLISYFSNTAANRCSAISKNAQTSTGRFEIPSSSSTAGKSSSSISEPDTSSREVTNPIDTTVSIDSSRTLENYVMQFAASTEELSFDNHVIAYNGTPKMSCMDFAERATGVSTTDLIPNSPIVPIERDSIVLCFPMTAKLLKEQNSEENCRYFMTFVSDGGQPTGHVLSSVANGELEFTSVKRSGMCPTSNMFFAVFFLIEDCKNEIESTEFQTTHKTFSSKIWSCEEGNYNPDAFTYGEWIKL